MKNHLKRESNSQILKFSNSQILKFFSRNFLRKSQVLVMVFLIVVFACQKSENLSPPNKPSIPTSSKRVEEDSSGINASTTYDLAKIKVKKEIFFLAFEDSNTFHEAVKLLSKVSSHKKILWGRQLGIESLLDIYESVIEAETDFYNSLKGNEKKLSSEQRKNLDKFGYATSTAIANADVISYDKDEGFDMKISDSFVASLVGKNRIIKVGRAIHKYYPTQIKVIQDGDENKISLLDKIHETDKDKSIIVFNINKINRTTNGRVETPSRSLSCDKTDTGYPATFKIITYDEFEVAGITQGSDLQYYAIFNHKAKLRNLTRSWFGSWVNSVAAIQLSGSVYYYNSSWIALLNWSKPFYINPHNGHTVEEPLLYYQQLLYLNTPIYLTGQCDGANQNQSIFCRISY